jgi:hypothetical protein
MPVGPLCRLCSAPLPSDIRWCTTCYTPVTLYSRREPLHEAGGYVGAPTPTPRTSRWRAGATTFGPAGRIAITVALLAAFPWGGVDGLSAVSALQLYFLLGWVFLATLVLRHVWRRERVADDAPPSWVERFRVRHPLLGSRVTLGRRGLVLVAVTAASVAMIAWVNLDDVDRYVWASLAIVTGVAAFLAVWNEL